MILSTLLWLGLSVANAAPSEQPPAKNYTVDLSGTTRSLKAGKPGLLKMQLRGEGGYKVSAEAPLKIGLEAKGVALAKKALGHKDATDKTSTAPSFDVKFSALQAGAASIEVDALFFVCDDRICEKKSEKFNVDVTVEP